MRLIHTSDLHLDICLKTSGMPASFGNRRRQSLRDVFHAIVERAGAWPADGLLIAGDLFEHDRVSRDTIHFLISEFKSIPEVPVFIAPGNHDPFTPDSPYATETWPKNVFIFSKPQWSGYSVSDGAMTVHGFGFDGPKPSHNPFGELRVSRQERGEVHVAVAHGSERGHQPPDKDEYAPFDAGNAATEGLDYLALGHFHSVTPIEGDFHTTIYYSGAPEGHSLRETGMHHYLEVEIKKGKTRVTPVPSSRIVYSSRRLECDGFESAQDVIEAIRKISQEEDVRQIARIIYTGSLHPAVHDEMGLVQDAASMDFEHLYLVDNTMPIEDYEELAREDTGLGAFVRTLNEEIAEAADGVQRQRSERARHLGVAAFRGREVEIMGLERG